MRIKKCGGLGCRCTLGESGGDYCSDACSRNTSEMTGPCPCGHEACTAAGPTDEPIEQATS